MKTKEYLKAFIEDVKYYDLKNKETKNILKYINVKNKTILDIGTGIGRLSFSLSKYAKEVIALDKDKRLKPYFKKHKKSNVKFVNQNLKNYSKTNKKFDIIILAWPTFNLNFIELIKRFCKKNTKIIFISCYNDTDFETIPDKIGIKISKREISSKKNFIKTLKDNFNLIKEKNIRTEYIYPDEKTAFYIIKNSFQMWYKVKLNKHKEKKLKYTIKKHKKFNKTIKFKEKIYFLILK